jgi:hypothetical protein
MTQQPQQKAPHICIATPCYGGKVFQNYFLSILNLVYATVRQQNMNLSFIIRGGDSLITRARNSIVAEFLSNDQYTHLLWIDADIGFTPESVFRLVSANKDIAAGIYPLKAYTFPDVLPAEMTKQEFANRYTKYPFNPIGASFTVENGFAEVKDAPTGMMLIKREVFYKMIEAYPELKYYPDHMVGLEGIAQKINDYYYNFFDTFIDDEGRYLSEDYAFCRLWQKMGGKVYADITSKLSHNGSHMFQGDLAATLSYNYKTEQTQKPAVTPQPVTEVALSTDPVSIDISGLAELGIQLEPPTEDLTDAGIDLAPTSEVAEVALESETPAEPLDEKPE